jgi:hypothetical protein
MKHNIHLKSLAQENQNTFSKLLDWYGVPLFTKSSLMKDINRTGDLMFNTNIMSIMNPRQVRDLYDFFDDNGIIITTVKKNDKWYWFIGTSSQEIGDLKEYNSRIEAETKAFIKAFKQLN